MRRGLTRSGLGTRIAAFGAAPAISALVPILALPAITDRYGAPAWVSIAIAQSVGAAAAVVVELGWGLTGTLRVARQSPRNRRRTAALALATRTIVLVPILLVTVVTVTSLVGPFPVEAAIVGAAAVIGAVNLSWFFIGTGAPGALLLTDALPRATLGVTAAALISFAGWPIAAYAGALLAAAVLVPVLGALVAGVGPTAFRGYGPRRLARAIGAQRAAVVGRVISAGYIALPVTLVSLVAAPSVVAVFAAAERLQRMVLTGLQAVPNALQHGVGRETDPARRRHRARRALVVGAVVGTAVAVGFTLGAPLASRLLFSGEATVPTELAALGGLLIVIVSCSRVTGSIMLVNAQRIRSIATSAAAGAIVGIPAILVLTATAGAAGGVLGELVAEATVLAVQFVSLRGAGRSAVAPTADRVLYVRVEDRGYPRNNRIRAALQARGADVVVLDRRRSGSKPARLIADALAIVRSGRGFGIYVVSEFSLGFVPLVWAVARLHRGLLVVDGFVGKYETAVDDWGLTGPRSPRAAGYRLVDRLSVALADVYLVDTTLRAETLSTRHPRARIVSLPVGAPAWARPTTAARHAGTRLLYYGSYLPLHGLPTVVDGLALLGDDVTLTLVGEAEHAGGEADTRAHAARVGVLDRCTFRPPVPASELAHLIAEHDVVLGVFGPSAKASSVIANKVWQGLACARVVITQDSVALAEIRDLVAPGQLLTVPAGDAEALAAAVRALHGDGGTAAPDRGPEQTGDRLSRYVARRFDAVLADLSERAGRALGTGWPEVAP